MERQRRDSEKLYCTRHCTRDETIAAKDPSDGGVGIPFLQGYFDAFLCAIVLEHSFVMPAGRVSTIKATDDYLTVGQTQSVKTNGDKNDNDEISEEATTCRGLAIQVCPIWRMSSSPILSPR